MTESAASRHMGGSSAISKLASFLRQAEDIAGQLNLHPSLHSAVAQAVKSPGPITGAEIADLVQALEHNDSKLCSRLGTKSFVLIFAVLRVSEPCWAQQRGLCLLTSTLDDSDNLEHTKQASASILDNTPLISRKARIGSDVLWLAVKHFCNGNIDDGIRRWMGLLTLGLLKDCKENVCLLLSDSQQERRQLLGHMVIAEHDEILRHIAGSVIKELVCQNVSVDSLWPAHVDSKLHRAFFEGGGQHSQWMELLEGHLDKIDSQTTTHQHKFVLFSSVLRLGENNYLAATVDTPSVLVTLHGLLSIVIQEYTSRSELATSAQYVDIPLENIFRVEIGGPVGPGPASSAASYGSFTVSMHLDEKREGTIYVNARAQRHPSVTLAFDSYGMADDLQALILSKKSQQIQPGYSHKSPLNSSQLQTVPLSTFIHQEVVNVSKFSQGQQPSSDKHITSHTLQRDVSKLTSVAEQISRSCIQPSGIAQLISTATTVLDVNLDRNTVVSLDAEVGFGTNQVLAHNNDRNARISATNPLDGTANARTEGDEERKPSRTQARPSLSNQDYAEVVDNIFLPRLSEDFNETDYMSSAKWKDGANVIETAPEFREDPGPFSDQKGSPPTLFKESAVLKKPGFTIPDKSEGMQMVSNQQHNKLLTAAAAETAYGLELISKNCTATVHSKRSKSSKVSQSLLDRQGERSESAVAHEDIIPAVKPPAVSNIEQKSAMPQAPKGSSRKVKKTYKGGSKVHRGAPPSFKNEMTRILDEQEAIFDIPDSPIRSAKVPLQAKQTKTAAKTTKSLATRVATPSSTKEKSKVNQAMKIAAARKNPSDLSNKGVARESCSGTDVRVLISYLVGSEHPLPGQDEISAKCDAISVGANKVRKSLGITSLAPNDRPFESRSTGLKIKAPNNERKSMLAKLNYPKSRRATAINANQKIQGISTKYNFRSERSNERPECSKKENLVESNSDGDHSLLPQERPEALVLVQRSKPIYHDKVLNDEQSIAVASELQASIRSHRTGGRMPQQVQAVAKTTLRECEVSSVTDVNVVSLEDSVQTLGDNLPLHGAEEIADKRINGSAGIHDDGSVLDPEFRYHQMATGDLLPTPQPVITKPQISVLRGFQHTEVTEEKAIEPVRLNNEGSQLESQQLVADTIASNGTTIMSVPLHMAVPTILRNKPANLVGAEKNLKSANSIGGTRFQNQFSKDRCLSEVEDRTSSPGHNAERTGVPAIGLLNFIGCGLKRHTNNKASPCGDRVKGRLAEVLPAENKPQVIPISSGEEASSDSELVTFEKEVHEPQSIASVVSKKRKSEEVIKDSIKRFKINTPRVQLRKEPAQDVDLVATDDHIQRKAIIIGFNSKGPRNQGVHLTKESKPSNFCRDYEDATVCNKTPFLSVKRKHREIQESSKHSIGISRIAKTPAEKRRRRVNIVLQTFEHSERNFVQTSSPPLPAISRNFSSQGSRVQDNGSPMATIDQIRRVNRIDTEHLLRCLTNEKDVNLSTAEDSEVERGKDMEDTDSWTRDLASPTLRSGFAQPELPQELKRYERRTSSNMKLLPSSPTAPSRMLKDMAAHKVVSDGRFVDVNTAMVVRAAEPHDPFVDINPDLPNPFLKMLREATQREAVKQVRCDKHGSTAHRKIVGEDGHMIDPDVTLVEAQDHRNVRVPSSSSGDPSSSPSSGSRRHSHHSESDNEKRKELARVWREALRPHQRRPLASLHEMSNRLVRHLLNRESAIHDSVFEYVTSGNKLLEALNGAYDESRQRHNTSISAAKKHLTQNFGDMEIKLGRKLREIKVQRVANAEKACVQEQQLVQDRLNAAILAYGTGQ